MTKLRKPIKKRAGMTPVAFTTFHYKLRKIVEPVGARYQWKREDGVSLSPSFTTAACAKLYRERMPMITDQEWQDQEIPFPG